MMIRRQLYLVAYDNLIKIGKCLSRDITNKTLIR
jgi:hypothetical protein